MADKHPFTDGVTSISPWQPEPNQVTVAALGKLVEELTEAASRAARCIIQGLDEADPESARSNRDELGREIADVQAAFAALDRASGGINVSETRRANKLAGFGRWFSLIRQSN